MKLLITGFAGFVSKHFLDFLDHVEPDAVILGIDKNIPEFEISDYKNIKITFKAVDLLDRNATNEILDSFIPEYILHLASVSSVAQSWQTPLDSFVNNTNIFLNLVEQVRVSKIKCRIISVGSSEEFGEVSEKELPLTEEHPLKPVSPYAVARVSQEMLSKIYADGFSLDIIMTRSFNHIGPGQREVFVISSFAKQLVQLAKNKSDRNIITTGNLSVIRDFVDVRDIVKAYYILFKKGRSGEVYNICSGKGVLLKDIISKMGNKLGLKVETDTDPDLLRPNENKIIVGSYEKLKKDTGWEPEILIEKSISDVLDYWDKTYNSQRT